MVGLHSSHPSGITDTLYQPAEVGRYVVLVERAHARWLQAARTRGLDFPWPRRLRRSHVRAIDFNGAAHDRRIALSSVVRGCYVQPRIWEAVTAIAPGTIIVANPDAVGGAGALIAVDPNTGAQTLLSQGQNFVEPSGVAFAKDGRILVSDTKAFQGDSGGLIAVNPANGLQTRVMGSTLFRRPFGMAVQADGQVLVACLEQAVIRVNPANGDFVNAVPNVKFDSPAGVALDAAGNVIVADVDVSGQDSRLFRIDAGVGASIRAHGEPPGAIYAAVAIEPSGNILVASHPNHAPPQLLRFPPTSGAVTKVSEGNKLVLPFGIGVEANGSIVVSDVRNGVIRINPATGTQTTISEGQHLAGSNGGPRGLAIR